MEVEITRATLEQLSQVQLVDLADEWGIDVPVDFDRQILIGEILEAVQSELPNEKRSLTYGLTGDASSQTIILDEDEPQKESFSYCNNTFISVVFRNPRWIYILWEIREPQFYKIIEDFRFKGFFLKVYCNGIENSEDGKNDFVIPVGQNDRSWCVYLNEKARSCKVQLCYIEDSKELQIASSEEILLPPSLTESLKPSLEQSANALQTLSGFEELKSLHFALHRQTFQ